MSTKLREKQRRREAEERRRKEQQRAARRRNLVTTVIIVVVAAVVVTLIVNERRAEDAPVGVGAQAAGCSDIEEFETEGNGHVPDGVNVQYGTTPPTSGDHYSRPADAGFYPPATATQIPDERFVHNLEHGQIVIWYQPGVSASVREDLQAYIEKQSGQQALALLGVPYDPAPAPITLTAWGAMQECDAVSEDVIDAFRELYQNKGPEHPGIPNFQP
jgi:Protein of unknown function (DUF3105)